MKYIPAKRKKKTTRGRNKRKQEEGLVLYILYQEVFACLTFGSDRDEEEKNII